MGNYQNASGGLKKMYIAELGAIVCAVLSIIPLVNIIAAIAAIKRELGAKWAVAVVLFQCSLAWLLACVVNVIGGLL